MRKAKLWALLIVCCAALLLTTLQAQADFVIPEAQPPADRQLQQAGANDDVAGAAVPVALQSRPHKEVNPAVRDHIVLLVREMLQQSNSTAFISAKAVKAAAPQEGYAKNLALEPANARFIVELAVSPAKKSVLGKMYNPVTVKVINKATGKAAASSNFNYSKEDEKKFKQTVAAFLTKQIHLTVAAASAKPSPSLQTWIETAQGNSVTGNSVAGNSVAIGGKIAIYYQSNMNGYVSLYHFNSSGQVMRLYPTRKQPYNFIKAGQLYRYPADGWLTISGPQGAETIKAVLTVLPSNTPLMQMNGLKFKTKPLHVIPTHFPVLFADGDMTNFFALPREFYTETHIKYQLAPRAGK